MVEVRDVLREFGEYMANGSDAWFARNHGGVLDGPIAYFCAEYGFYESLGIYSGGLGVLAGDHTKTTSDMALPFVGVGLLYRNGYFHQTIDADGHQEHAYPDYDLTRLPVSRVQADSGEPLQVQVELPGRDLQVAVWLAQVGRTPVLLLDTDIPDNGDADRPITHILYVRGREMRLHQELVLGVGGVRALRALGDRAVGLAPQRGPLGVPARGAGPGVRRDRRGARRRPGPGPRRQRLHDPHPGLGRQRALRGRPRPARRRARCSRATGGRTPAASRSTACSSSGMGVDGDAGQFDMTAFSLRLTRAANAVSQLHAETADATWRSIAPHGIGGVTNGIHTPSWVGHAMGETLGEGRPSRPRQPRRARASGGRFWDRLDQIPTDELWETHQRQKLELAVFARRRLRNQFARHGEAPAVLDALEAALDPDVLTIGFARRFATYKRAGLLFSDIDRLARLVRSEERPIQIVYAGKAHPADRPGQQVIQEIFGRSMSDQLRGRVFILEDYDIRIARYLVAGVDIWLNNPRRPLEASGTSGMKAAANGVVNLSVLDGWWDEGFTGDNGWAIGGRETNPDEAAQDWADAQDLYRILEDEVLPRYYERDAHGIPVAWVELMRRSMASTLWRFSTTRMLHDYVERMYLPNAVVPPEAMPSDGVPPRAAVSRRATSARSTGG